VPVITIVGFIGRAAAPAMLVLAAFEVARRAGNFALSKPAREALFTIVPRAEKYKAKGLIDTFVYRGGDTAGALADMALAGLGLVAAWLAVPLGAASLAMAIWLGRQEASRAKVSAAVKEPPIPGAGSLAAPASPHA
jgi:AAA family ATP:ADP antiporter